MPICQHCHCDFALSRLDMHETNCLHNPDVMDRVIDTVSALLAKSDLPSFRKIDWDDWVRDTDTPGAYSVIRSFDSWSGFLESLGVSSATSAFVCEHCGQTMDRRGIKRHPPVCLHNPDAMDLVVESVAMALRQSATSRLSRDSYDRAARKLDAPKSFVIEQEFGAWSVFQESIGLTAAWGRPGGDAEWYQLGQYETYGDMVQAGKDDRSLFAEMARRRYELGIGNQMTDGMCGRMHDQEVDHGD